MTSTVQPDLDGDFEDSINENPFPGSDKREWTERLSQALAWETGLPQSVTDPIAVYVSRPKRLLTRQGGQFRLKPSVLIRDGGLRILNATAHGFTGCPSEYNERIRSIYDSPLRPGAREDRILPALTTGRNFGKPAPFVTTVDPVDNTRLARLLEEMTNALDDADGDRGYRLIEDMENHGQKTVTLHAPLVRQIRETTDAGTHIRLVTDLMAIKGSNRARARLALHSLTVRDIVFGFSVNEKMGITQANDVFTADPTYWVPKFADELKAAYDDPNHPGHHIARRAAKVATIQIQIIVGAADLDSFHNSVFDPNRVDHRRPPLDYKLADKAASDMRAILRERTVQGLISEQERAWLAGEGPDPQYITGETLVDARDRRDRALFRAIFPEVTARADRALVRRVIGEPAPSQTGRRHVDNRARMVSAVISDGYSARWNPRVLDGLFAANTIHSGLSHFFDEPWSTLLNRATSDDASLEAFILTRGMHWLAEHKIIEADRGSVGAQTHGISDSDDGDEAARRIRRTMTSIREALKLNPARTIGLMRELAQAANNGVPPRQVDPDGHPINETKATRAWFDEAFPKTPRKRNTSTPPPDDNPKQPNPTPQQLLTAARVTFSDAVTFHLPQAFKVAFEAGRELQKAASNADMPAFPENVEDTVIPALDKALAAIRKDAKALVNILSILKYGGSDPEDFLSESAKFLEQEADQ